MKQFYFIAFLATIVLCLLNSCDDETTGIATYTGKVINEYTDEPLADEDVKVTNGDKIHSMTKTLDDGTFSVEVRLSEIDDTYYILIGNNTFGTKKMDIPAFGLGEYNVGTIIIKGQTKTPVVETTLVRVDGKSLIFCEGNVVEVGEAAVSEKGFCWGTSSPTIKNNKIECGEGKGGFSCQIEDIPDVHAKNYYIRAYATNSYGTSYGETVMIDHRNPYNLPMVENQHVKYIVLPYDLGNFYAGASGSSGISTPYARKVCENLDAYDWNDWEVPAVAVLELLYEEKSTIGGFTDQKYWSDTEVGYYVFYWVDFSNGKRGSSHCEYDRYGVRPVRKY